MSRAVWTDTADYMILRCAACGMPHIVHRQMMRDGISCRDCGAGPLIPEGYAIMIDKRPADIIVKTQVDTSDLDKVQRMVDEIQTCGQHDRKANRDKGEFETWNRSPRR